MRTLLTALAATTLMAGSVAVVWKAEAGMMPGMASLPLTNSYSPVEKVRRCVCGAYGCACGQRYRRGPIGGTTDTRVPAARSPYASIRDVGLTSFGRLVCGAFLIPTNALTANNKGARDLGWIV